jgi:hypothetical protein
MLDVEKSVPFARVVSLVHPFAIANGTDMASPLLSCEYDSACVRPSSGIGHSFVF